MSRKTVVVGITGGIAAFKSAQLVSDLTKMNVDVEVIMTKNAAEFITPLTFESLIKRKVIIDTFDRNFEYDVKHISIAKKADVFIIVPATANFIAKAACGIADDMLTTTFLAAKCHKIICPAMNTAMIENPITQRNIETCKAYGMEIIDSAVGLLACGDTGKGKLADLSVIKNAIERALVSDKKLKNLKVVVTAGPTMEAIDPVRFITNHSSGKMGYELARAAQYLGAQVVLISGKVSLAPVEDVKMIYVASAQEMAEAVIQEFEDADIVIKAAAVADYTPKNTAKNKIKKHDNSLNIECEKTMDILRYLGEHKKSGQVLCGFAMETQNLIENAKEKLIGKNADMIIANDLNEKGAGFQGDTNKVTMIFNDHMTAMDCMSKKELSFRILDECLKCWNEKRGK